MPTQTPHIIFLFLFPLILFPLCSCQYFKSRATVKNTNRVTSLRIFCRSSMDDGECHAGVVGTTPHHPSYIRSLSEFDDFIAKSKGFVASSVQFSFKTRSTYVSLLDNLTNRRSSLHADSGARSANVRLVNVGKVLLSIVHAISKKKEINGGMVSLLPGSKGVKAVYERYGLRSTKPPADIADLQCKGNKCHQSQVLHV